MNSGGLYSLLSLKVSIETGLLVGTVNFNL